MISLIGQILRLLAITMAFTSLIGKNYANAQSELQSGNLQFNYAFVVLKDSGESQQLVSAGNNHILKTGDKLKFYIEALIESYFYLFHMSPSGV